mmetsp:Transcript_94450/g.291168  ORF Transcript_94450/g.291168 Transcript_94450/m.291168 type:complete len:342 (+) Transcript_94450:106-1131(+)
MPAPRHAGLCGPVLEAGGLELEHRGAPLGTRRGTREEVAGWPGEAACAALLALLLLPVALARQAVLHDRPQLVPELCLAAALELPIAVRERLGRVGGGLEHDAAVGRHQVVVASDELRILVALADVLGRFQVGVDEAVPAGATRQAAAVRHVPGVEGHEQRGVPLGGPLRGGCNGAAAGAGLAGGGAHFAAGGHAPHGGGLVRTTRRPNAGIQDRGALVQHEGNEIVGILPVVMVPRDVLLGEERGTPEEAAVVPSHGDQQPAEAQEATLLLGAVLPGEPIELVLVPSVVVAAQRPAVLVAHREHGRACRKEEGHQHVPHLPLPQEEDRGLVAGALFAAVP